MSTEGNKGSFLVFSDERGVGFGGGPGRRSQLISDQTQSCRSSFVISIVSRHLKGNTAVAARFSGKKIFRRINKSLEVGAEYNGTELGHCLQMATEQWGRFTNYEAQPFFLRKYD